MRRIHIAVLMGGPSAEHEVSLRSGRQILAALDRRRYRVTAVRIGRDGRWAIGSSAPVPLAAGLARLKRLRIAAAVILALHGEFGEDGRMQAALEAAGIPYTGSGVAASALGMDKVRSAALFRAAGLVVPEFITLARREWTRDRAGAIARARLIRLPMVVKPACLGSSVGVSIVRRPAELGRAIGRALRHDHEAIVQRYVRGVEVTCGVIEDARGVPRPLPVTEIVPKSAAFFDYRAKYAAGASEEITPARLPAGTLREIQGVALAAHRAIGCAGISRTDMIVQIAKRKSQSAKLWVLEINTLPGMTKTSLVPQAAAAAGIPFPKLLDQLIRQAFRR